jgi:adenosine deaminase
MKNILVTTLGTSWQILPELVGWTNPDQYDFFKGNKAVACSRKKQGIHPVDEFWVITTRNQKGMDELRAWEDKWKVNIKFFIYNIKDLSSEEDIKKFRSFLFRVVLAASESCGGGRLYLSLTGGRKTMSTDMYEAGTLFGCDALFHIIDVGDNYLPVVIEAHIQPNVIISADEKRISMADYPLPAPSQGCIYEEDEKLVAEIERRKKDASQVYANIYTQLQGDRLERDVFRKLYFLPPDVLRRLKEVKIGTNPAQDLQWMRALPKAELHTHLGGVLTPAEIIEVAQEHPHPDEKIQEILSYQGREEAFEKKIFGKYLDKETYHKIGIEAYQKLGDYQGSKLLKSKETLAATVGIYARKLIADNVRYVELRCSPYKYVAGEFSANDVVNTIMNQLDKYHDELTYRLVCIVGRQNREQEGKRNLDIILENIKTITELIKDNERFARKLVGIDLAGTENAVKPEELREPFRPFFEHCIHITIHAGETEPVDNIWQAVYPLNAERIGHGLKLQDNQELMNHIVDRGIGIELCPSSNRQIVGYGKEGDATYPLKDYMAAGLKVCLNTDNCGISRTSLSEEFLEAARLCGGLSLWDCFVLIRNSLLVSFVDKKTKRQLLHDFEDEIFSWVSENIF